MKNIENGDWSKTSVPESCCKDKYKSTNCGLLKPGESITNWEKRINKNGCYKVYYKEVKKELSDEAKIDPERLRQAVMDDLMQDRLMGWLEENSTLTEKAPAADDGTPAAKKKAAAKKAPAKTKSKADAKD